MFERDESKLTKRIGDMIGELIGRDTTLKPIPVANRTLAGMTVGGTFGAENVKTTIRVEADLACATLLGAALAMIPPSRVQEVVKSAKPDEELCENTREVFNVLTRALTMDGSIRARLTKFDKLDPKAGKPQKHAFAWELSVAGYGTGKLGLTISNG